MAIGSSLRVSKPPFIAQPHLGFHQVLLRFFLLDPDGSSGPLGLHQFELYWPLPMQTCRYAKIAVFLLVPIDL